MLRGARNGSDSALNLLDAGSSPARPACCDVTARSKKFCPRWLRPFSYLVAALTFAAFAHAAVPGAQGRGAEDPGAMMRAVAEYWLASQQADGLLPYGFDFLTGKADEDAKSSGFIAREAGAMWVWARYYAAVRDDRYVEPLRRGLQALAKRSIPFGKPRAQWLLDALRIYQVPFGRMTLTRALHSVGLLYANEGSARALTTGGLDGAWTGSTALALLAELEYARASGDQRIAASRQAWRDALLALYVPGHGFRDGPASIDDDDDFAAGEAWLALAAYSDFDPRDTRVRDLLADVDSALIARFTKRPNSMAFQWSSMAALQRWLSTHDPRFIEFARNQARVFTARLPRRVNDDPYGNRCGWLEGFGAMRALLARAGDDVTNLDAAIAREAVRLPRLQIADQSRMTLGGGGYLVSPALPRFAGAFLWQEYGTDTRVDAEAHCLSALLLTDTRAHGTHAPASTATEPAKRTPQ